MSEQLENGLGAGRISELRQTFSGDDSARGTLWKRLKVGLCDLFDLSEREEALCDVDCVMVWAVDRERGERLALFNFQHERYLPLVCSQAMGRSTHVLCQLRQSRGARGQAENM